MLTDTFQLYESKQQAFEGTFPENSARVKRQKASPIRVVIANPPYSAQQDSENDNNQNIEYPTLDQRISTTYVTRSAAKLKKNYYSSEIRALRWASDRIEHRGVVGFVTNGSFIDRNMLDGLRACLPEDFSSIHVFNLRGNQYTSGELSRREAGKIFGSGSRNGIAILILAKNPSHKGPARLLYHDIGDYLSREDKLKTLVTFASIAGITGANKWVAIKPNSDHDWINQRDPAFERFHEITGNDASTFFGVASPGISTARDQWVYSYSQSQLAARTKSMIEVYNRQVEAYAEAKAASPDGRIELADVVDADPRKISWSAKLKASAERGTRGTFSKKNIRPGIYRPFCRQFLYLDSLIIERPGKSATIQPKPELLNRIISVTGSAASVPFSALMVDVVPNFHFQDTGQTFPLYVYEQADESSDLNFGKSDVIDGYRRRDAITDAILKTFRGVYGAKVTKEDIFYYVYGVLHSPEYRTRFAADLKKMLPRIPLTREPKDYVSFVSAGRELAKWHLNYETVPTWPVEEIHDTLPLDEWELYKVQKMTFARPTAEQKAAGAKWDKTRIIYNSHITITKLPLEAYDYVVNGKPAIEWIMERYQYSRDKDSGIVNDPNDWCKEHKQPRYIIDLVARIVRVSIETMKLVKALPALNETTAAKNKV